MPEAVTDETGCFAIDTTCEEIGGRRLLFIAGLGQIEQQFDPPRCLDEQCLFKGIDLGCAAASLQRGAGPFEDLQVDPDSTGVVRAVDADGLENFSDSNLDLLVARTRLINEPDDGETVDSAAQQAQRVAETLIEPQLRIETSEDGRTAYYVLHNTSIFKYAITTLAIDGGGGDGGVNSCEVRGFTPGGAAVGDDVLGIGDGDGLVDSGEVFVSRAISSAQSIAFSPSGLGHVCRNCPGADDLQRDATCATAPASCGDTYILGGSNTAEIGSPQSPLGEVALVDVMPTFGTCVLFGQTFSFDATSPTVRLSRNGPPPDDGFFVGSGEVVIFASETTISPPGFGAGGFRLGDASDCQLSGITDCVVKGFGADIDVPSRRVQLEFDSAAVPLGVFPRALVAAQINDNAGADLALVDEGAGTLRVLLNDGAGQFTAASIGPTARVGDFPVALAVGNVVGNGRPDIVTANEGSSTVTIAEQTSDGAFMVRPPIAVAPFPIAVALGSIDTDTDLDIITAHEPAGLSVLLNSGTGSFTAVPPAALPPLTGLSYPSALAVADFTQDGGCAACADVAVANQGSGSISIFRSTTGPIRFAAPIHYDAIDHPIALVAATLDGDSLPDLAVASETDHVVVVLLNQGGGAFAVRDEYRVDPRNQCVGLQKCPAGLFPSSLAIGDFDADGNLDLVTANEGSGDFSVLLNRGDGTFDPVRVFPVPEFPAGTVTTLVFPIAVGAAGLGTGPGVDLVAVSDVSNTALLLYQR
jgi:hypothetical protein